MGDDHGGILVLSTLGLDGAGHRDAMELLVAPIRLVEVNVTPDRGLRVSAVLLRKVVPRYRFFLRGILCWRGERAPEANDAGHPVVLGA